MSGQGLSVPKHKNEMHRGNFAREGLPTLQLVLSDDWKNQPDTSGRLLHALWQTRLLTPYAGRHGRGAPGPRYRAPWLYGAANAQPPSPSCRKGACLPWKREGRVAEGEALARTKNFVKEAELEHG